MILHLSAYRKFHLVKQRKDFLYLLLTVYSPIYSVARACCVGANSIRVLVLYTELRCLEI